MKRVLCVVAICISSLIALGADSAVWKKMMIESRVPIPAKETRSPKTTGGTSLQKNTVGFAEEKACMKKYLPESITSEGLWETIFSSDEEKVSECLMVSSGITNRFSVHSQLGNTVPIYWQGENYAASEDVDYAAVTNFVRRFLCRADGKIRMSGFVNILERSKIRIELKGKLENIPYDRFWFVFIDDFPGANWHHPCRYIYLSRDLSSFTVVYRTMPPIVKSGNADEPLRFDQVEKSISTISSIKTIRNSISASLNAIESNSITFSGDVSRSHFVLISGGGIPENNGIRFWADTAMFYSTLTLKYKVPKDQIHVYVSDGTNSGRDANLDRFENPVLVSSPLDLDGDGVSDIDGPATRSYIKDVFSSLKNSLTANDQLFVFITSHGDSDGVAGQNNYDCIVSLFNDEVVRDDELHSWTKEIPCPVAFAVETCFSGGLCDDITQTSERLIATACNHMEFSYGGGGGGQWGSGGAGQTGAYNCWMMPLVVAFRGCIPRSAQYSNSYPWADGDSFDCSDWDLDDGKVSFYEAALVALYNDDAACLDDSCIGGCGKEHPQLSAKPKELDRNFFVLKQGEPYLNITASEVDVPAEGGFSSVRIESNGSFNLSADKDWILIENASGNGTKEVKFEVLRNSSASGRKGTIKISNDYGNECILSVSQAGMTAPARPVVTASDGTSSDSVRITWENSARALSYSIKRAESTTGNKTLLDSNAVSPYVDNDVVPGKTYYYWVTAVNEVGENESVSDSGYRSISLNLDATGNVYTKDGGESSFSVSGNSPWTVTCADDWISLITTSGNGTGIVSFTLDKNYDGESRYGTILVTSGSISKTITVTQPGRVLVAVDSGTVTINTGASSPSFNVSSSGKTYYGKVVDGTAVYSFDYLEIGSSVSVSISGSRPLVIESETDMKIACDLDVSGTSSGRCGGGIGGAGGSGGASVSGGSGGSGGSYGFGGNGWIIDNYAGETQGQSGSSGSAGSTGYGGSAGKSGTSGSSGGKGFGSTGSAASGGSRGTGGTGGSAASSVGRAGSGGYAGSEGNAGGSGTKGGSGTAGNNGSSGSNGVNAFTTALTTDVIIAGSGGGGGGGGGSGGSGGGGSGGGGGGGGGGTTEAQARAYSSNTVYINRKQYQGAMGGFGGGGGSGGKGASSGAGGAGGAGGHGGGAVVLKAAGVLQLSGCVDVSAANGSRNGSSGSSASSASYGGSGGSGSTGQSAMTTTGYTYLSPSSGCRGGDGGAGGNGGSGGKGGSGGTGGYGSPGMVKLYASVLLASNGSIAGENGDNSTTTSRCGGLSLGTNMKPTALTSQKPTVPTTIKCGEMGGAVSSKIASFYDESVMVPVVGQLKTLHADVAGICETGNYALSQVSSIAAEGSVEGLTVKRLTTLFDGYDQIFLINNSSTKVGPVEAEISGVACEIPELDAGEAWTTCVPTGVSVTGSEALIVSHSSIAAEASGKSGTVSVTANCGWTASKNVSWITVSPTSGSGNGTISYTIAANTTVQSRPGTITVTSSGGITRTIAVSQEGLPMYDVTFNSNGGTLSGDATRNVVSGAVIGALPTPIRDGYTFLGWFTAAEGGEKVTESTVVTGNMTLYAQWEKYAGVDDDGYALASMFEYEMCAEGVRITKYKGSAAVVNIPPTIDGFSVISIDDYAFMDCNSLTSVTIPEGVQSIGAMAFRNCGSLTHVSIPDSVVEIGSDPFIYSNYSLFSWDGKGTKLVDGWVVGSTDSLGMWDVDLDLIGVRGICEGAFYSKDYITSVVIPGSVMCVGGNTFRFCSSLTNVMVCSGVKSIGECAFGECGSLTKVTISDSVTNIAQSAFYGCSELVFVMIPLTLKEQIEARDVFADCSPDLQIDYYCTVTFNVNGGALSGEGTIEAIVDETISTLPVPVRDGYTFLGWFTAAEGGEQITESTVVTGDVTYYAHWEKEGSDGGGEEYTSAAMFEYEIQDGGVIIKKYIGKDPVVNIPPFIDGNPVVNIGSNAFRFCVNLTSIVLPNSVTNIGSEAFYCCSKLTNVAILNNAINVASDAFAGCYEVREATVPGWKCQIPFDVVTNLVITPGTTSIKSGAFEGCWFTNVTIPDSVTHIQYNAFRFCGGLKNVIIPDSIRYIGDSAFWDCDALRSITIPNNVTTIENHVFYDCNSLTSVTIPNSVTSIGFGAFSGCNSLTSVTIPNSVTSIGSDAFRGCSGLTSVAIPNSVKNIGSKAFYDCINIREATVPGWKCEIPFDVVTNLVITPGTTSIKNSAFEDCSSLTSVTIPDSVKCIEQAAFRGCSGLTSIAIPSSVTEVGYAAFSGCVNVRNVMVPGWKCEIPFNNITNLTISLGTESIRSEAFKNCSRLISVNVANSVTNIGHSAFSGCGNLRSVHITSLAQWCTISFGYDSNPLIYAHNLYVNDVLVENLTIPNSVTNIGRYAFEGCSSLTSVTIPKSVTNIGNSAFNGCSGLTSVVIPDSVNSIGEQVFRDCTSLINVIIPDSVTTINGSTFNGCSSLTSVVIPDSVTSIGRAAFEGCSGLISVTIPQSVTNIGYSAFSRCSSLESVIIPNSVTTINGSTFNGCSSLTSVVIPDSVTSIEYSAFAGCRSLTSIVIPDSVTSIDSSAFEGCIGFADENGFIIINNVLYDYCGVGGDIEIPSKVTVVADYAFEACFSLTSVAIPSNVAVIGDYAFSECGQLHTVSGGEGLERVGIDAFANTLFLYGKDSWEDVYANEDYVNGNGLDLVYLGNFIVGRRGWLNEAYWSDYNVKNDWLYDLTIPEGTTGFADGLFGMLPITSVVIPGSVMRIPDYAFDSCNYLKKLSLGHGIQEIADCAFQYAGSSQNLDNGVELFESLSLPETVKKIGVQAFYGSSLRYVHGLDAVENVDENAFEYTPYAEGIWYAPVLQIDNDIVTGITWEYRSDDGCITNYVLHIPDGVTAIGDYAFQNFNRFSNIRLPESLRDIGNGAFECCSSMEEINIPEGVSNINDWTFGQCSRLVEVKLPSTVTNIGQYAFSYCHSLRNINMPEQVVSIGDDAFYDCDSLSNIVFPNTLEYIGDYAFDDCNSLSEVVIPSSIKHIGVDAFGYHDSEHHYLKRITIPQALCESNEDNSWFCLRDIGCYGITNLVIESGVTNIGEAVFSGLWSLQSVTIPDSVTSIGDNAFSDCSSLTSVTIPYSVTSIGNGAFSSCLELRTVSGGVGLEYVGQNVFEDTLFLYGEDSWEDVEANEDYMNDYGLDLVCLGNFIVGRRGELQEAWNDEYFDENENWTWEYNLVIPEGITGMADGIFDSVPITSVTIPNSVNSIPKDAFASTMLESIVIPENVLSIGEWAFRWCENLSYAKVLLALKEQVEQGEVFADCSPDLQIEYYESQPLALPVITPADGSEFYEDSCTVTISCETEGASIYYTTDGTTPRPKPANLYSGPFEIIDTMTVKAIAVKGDERTDMVSATLIKRELTLPVAVDAPALTFTTGGDAQWTPVFDGSAKVGGSLAQSGALSWSETDDDPSETWMETTVAGAGTFSFWWKVDCEDDPWGATWDRFEVYTNGVEAARIDGKTEWEKIEFTFADSRTYTVRWRFYKDDWDDEKLPDIAWVDDVVWTPVSTDITVDVGDGKNVVVPASWIDKYGDILAAAGGDKTAALLRTAANGRKVWECFMLGVDPTKADDDFRITRFWMENGKPMFEYSHTSDGAGRSFVSRIRKLGTQTLDDPWQEVPSEGNPLFRFFTVEVQLP